MKILAFIACISFIAYLLKLDRKQSDKVSPWLWLPTIWMLVCASKPLGIWFGGGGGVEFTTSSVWDRTFLSAIFFIGFLILLKRNFHWIRLFRENGWLMLLLTYMLVSILWSDIPFVSMKRWFREFGAVVMALIVLTDPSPRQAMLSILRRTAYIHIPFSLFLIKYVPGLGIDFHRWTGERMWVGVALQKNGLGRLCVICGFFLIWTLYRRWKGRDVAVSKYHTHAECLLLFLTLWLLKGPGGAYPATAVVCLLLGLTLFSFLVWRQTHHIRVNPAPIGALLATLLAYGITTPIISATLLTDILAMLGRDTTFTGRTAIWAKLLPVASDQPYFGLGFGAFWTPLTRVYFAISEAHNGYLDTILTVGIVGLGLMVIFLLTSCRKAVKGLSIDFDWAALWICCLFMTVLHNATESSINSLASQLTALLVFLAVTFSAVAADSDEEEG